VVKTSLYNSGHRRSWNIVKRHSTCKWMDSGFRSFRPPFGPERRVEGKLHQSRVLLCAANPPFTRTSVGPIGNGTGRTLGGNQPDNGSAVLAQGRRRGTAAPASES